MICFNKKRNLENQRKETEQSYSHNDQVFLTLYKDAVLTVFDKAIQAYDVELKNKAINLIFQVSQKTKKPLKSSAKLKLSSVSEPTELIKIGEEILKDIFKTEHSRLVVITDTLKMTKMKSSDSVGSFLDIEDQNKFVVLDKDKKFKILDNFLKGGICYHVYKTRKIKISRSNTAEPLFNMLCDLDTSLPTLTAPIYHPENREIIAVFQVAIWQEVFHKMNINGIDFSNEILVKLANLFAFFFSFILSSFVNLRGLNKFNRKSMSMFRKKKKKKEKSPTGIYEVARLKMLSKMQVMNVKEKNEMGNSFMFRSMQNPGD